MSFSSDKPAPSKQKKQKFWQTVILFIGAGSFLATALIPLISSFTHPQAPPTENKANSSPTAVDPTVLKQQETGFVAVLKREPNNSTALQGLVKTRLQLGDLQGVVDPLKQLIKMYPDEKVLKDLLAQVENNLEKTNTPAAPKTTSSQTPPTNTSPKTTTP